MTVAHGDLSFRTFRAAVCGYVGMTSAFRRWGQVLSLGVLLQSLEAHASPPDGVEQQRQSLCSVMDLEHIARVATETYVRETKRHPFRYVMLESSEHLKSYSTAAYAEFAEKARSQYTDRSDCTVFEEIRLMGILDNPLGGSYVLHAEFRDEIPLPILCVGREMKQNVPFWIDGVQVPYVSSEGWLTLATPCFLSDGRLAGFRQLFD